MKAQDAIAQKNQATLDQWDAETRTVNDKRIEAEYKINELFKAGMIDRSEQFQREDAHANAKADALDKQQLSASIAESIKASNDAWYESMSGQAEEARLAQERMRHEFEKT